jgi:putative transposase
MKSVATIKVKIPHRESILDTMRQYSKACQEVVDWGWELMTHNKRELHDITYYPIRRMTDLPAQLVCSSRDVACGVLKGTGFETKKPICKEYMTIRYDARSFSFKNGIVSLSTIKGRVRILVSIPGHFRQYLSWKVCSANMIYDRKRRLFLHIMVSRDTDADTSFCGNGKTVGIDVGISNIAVTSQRQFFNGKDVKRKKLQFRRLRTKLQAKGTRASRRLLKHISGREKRFMAWVNHNISKEIAESISKGDTIVMENLTNIRKQSKGRRFNFWLHSWSFFQLQSFVEYKAVRKGCRVIRIDPRDTSKTCSRCGSLHTSRTKSFFKCLHCDYSLNADLNASFNLAKHHSIPDGVSGVVNHPYLTHDDAEASSDEPKQSVVKSPLL